MGSWGRSSPAQKVMGVFSLPNLLPLGDQNPFLATWEAPVPSVTTPGRKLGPLTHSAQLYPARSLLKAIRTVCSSPTPRVFSLTVE